MSHDAVCVCSITRRCRSNCYSSCLSRSVSHSRWAGDQVPLDETAGAALKHLASQCWFPLGSGSKPSDRPPLSVRYLRVVVKSGNTGLGLKRCPRCRRMVRTSVARADPRCRQKGACVPRRRGPGDRLRVPRLGCGLLSRGLGGCRSSVGRVAQRRRSGRRAVRPAVLEQ